VKRFGVLILLLFFHFTRAVGIVQADSYGLATFYGTTDGYLGERHAASWWGQIPDGFPEYVDEVHFGVATRSRSLPFGTKLELRIMGLPNWAEPELSFLIGRKVVVTVVDRLPNDSGVSFDLWPAAFTALVGWDGLRDRLGICEISWQVLEKEEIGE